MSSKIFAIGDIHGCYKTLKSLLDKINPSKTDSIIFLGDYIDRGSRVKEVIDFLIELQEREFQVIFLMGNHESMLLDALSNSSKEATWRYNGADNTLQSFGISQISQLDKKYLRFFQKLELYTGIDNFLFVHAGFNDDDKLAFKDKHMNLWSRSETYTAPCFKNKTIIHGHTPISINELKIRLNNFDKILNIDTGCVYNFHSEFGYLTALEIPSLTLHYEVNCD